jgi:two-component system, OmpR family, sensor histidine kinase CpxA
MKVRFPLYARILLWFFLNLLLLAAGSYVFFRIQYHVGLDSLLAGQAGERITWLSDVVAHEFADAAPDEHTRILQKLSDTYGLRFYLFRPDGVQIAGETVTLPAKVSARLAEFGPRPGPRGAGIEPLPPGAPEDDRERRGPPRDGPDGAGPEGPPPVLEGGARPGPDAAGGSPRRARQAPKFMERTTNPVRYWVGIRLAPLRDPARPAGGAPPWLLAVSETLSGGGLFFDVRPWLAIGTGAVLLSVLFWLPLVRGITRAISQITRATEEVAGGHFEVRVPAVRRDELGRLGQAINIMAVRLADYVKGQKRFLGDVAHELCSPIARIQVALGILEQRAGKRELSYVADMREEIEHMSSLVNELLSFSKAALGASTLKLQPVSVRAVAEKAVSREAADSAGVRIDVAEDLWVLADPELLARSISNLLRNAIRYAGHAGPIIIAAHADGGDVLISIADCGPGVPEAELARIFEPFYRVDISREAATGGVGLGLSIVKTCIESCRGTITCRNRQPAGLEVTIRLPVATAVEP